MNKGMLWFDNSPKTSLTEKVRKAADYYRNKYGARPTLCMVNPSMLEGKPTADSDGISIRPYRPVLPGYLWIGMTEAAAK